MACVRRYITGTESIGQFIQNSRKMFLLQVNKQFITINSKLRHRIELIMYYETCLDIPQMNSMLFFSTRCQ